MPDPLRHADDRNFLESLLRHVPGFHGYLERQYRRDSDMLLRKWLADRLSHGKQPLDDYLRQLVDAGQITELPQWERVRSRLDGFVSRLRAAVAGYSAVFDLVRVDQHLLDQVYEHDLSLVEGVNALHDSLAKLPAPREPGDLSVSGFLTQIDKLEQAFRGRHELLEGLDEDQPNSG